MSCKRSGATANRRTVVRECCAATFGLVVCYAPLSLLTVGLLGHLWPPESYSSYQCKLSNWVLFIAQCKSEFLFIKFKWLSFVRNLWSEKVWGSQQSSDCACRFLYHSQKTTKKGWSGLRGKTMCHLSDTSSMCFLCAVRCVVAICTHSCGLVCRCEYKIFHQLIKNRGGVLMECEWLEFQCLKVKSNRLDRTPWAVEIGRCRSEGSRASLHIASRTVAELCHPPWNFYIAELWLFTLKYGGVVHRVERRLRNDENCKGGEYPLALEFTASDLSAHLVGWFEPDVKYNFSCIMFKRQARESSSGDHGLV